jgi:hypothetical protein
MAGASASSSSSTASTTSSSGGGRSAGASVGTQGIKRGRIITQPEFLNANDVVSALLTQVRTRGGQTLVHNLLVGEPAAYASTRRGIIPNAFHAPPPPSQVAEEPAYASMLRELLFSQKGQELYLRNPRLFNLPTGLPPWREAVPQLLGS